MAWIVQSSSVTPGVRASPLQGPTRERERERVQDLGGTVPANGQEGEAAVKVSDKL